MNKLRVKAKAILEKSGTEIDAVSGDRTRPLQVRLIQALLRAAGDPDAEFYEDMVRGVPLGVVGEMPSTQAMFEVKTAWAAGCHAADDMIVRVSLSKAKGKSGTSCWWGGWEQYRSQSRRTLSDQLRHLGDIQAVMHHLAAKHVPHFMLLFDVRKAHRLVPVREEDWGYPACLGVGDADEHLVGFLLVMEILGVPLSWKKV